MMNNHDLEDLMGVATFQTRAVTAEHFTLEHGLSPNQLRDHRQLKADMTALAAQIRAAAALGLPLIYAVLRREEAALKIGYSKHLTQRLRRMPGSRLVAIKIGGRGIEQEVHERLATSRVRLPLPGGGVTEHFLLTDDVLAWVNETRHAVGLDALDIAS